MLTSTNSKGRQGQSGAQGVHDGFVHLVGAGPGDPDLLTVKALRVIEAADVVVYDRLVSSAVMELVPANVRRIDVWKCAGHHPVPQEQINSLLVSLAGCGLRVVRLKGGDPFVFGRGGEEAIALASAGVAFDVIPGITSAQACAAAAKVPLTHRDLATGVRFLTGHRRQDEVLDFDWAGLADSETTLVVYMGLTNISEIAIRLIAHGLDAATPVLAISGATRPEEVRLTSTLGRIGADCQTACLAAPTLFVIGAVAGLVASMGCAERADGVARLLEERETACVAAE